MRLVLLVLSLISISSCVSVRRARAQQDARLRAAHAVEAAAIRQRYYAAAGSRLSLSRALLLSPDEPTPPPLVPVEPVRVPLRPRAP